MPVFPKPRKEFKVALMKKNTTHVLFYVVKQSLKFACNNKWSRIAKTIFKINMENRPNRPHKYNVI